MGERIAGRKVRWRRVAMAGALVLGIAAGVVGMHQGGANTPVPPTTVTTIAPGNGYPGTGPTTTTTTPAPTQQMPSAPATIDAKVNSQSFVKDGSGAGHVTVDVTLTNTGAVDAVNPTVSVGGYEWTAATTVPVTSVFGAGWHVGTDEWGVPVAQYSGTLKPGSQPVEITVTYDLTKAQLSGNRAVSNYLKVGANGQDATLGGGTPKWHCTPQPTTSAICLPGE